MVKTIFKGGFDDNFSYLLTADDSSCAIIDPCGKCAKHLAQLDIPQEKMKYILITHGHSDHFDALDEVKKLYPAAGVAGFAKGEFAKDIPLDDGSTLAFGSSCIETVCTPGHSRDSVCYIYAPDRAIFTGDTLFIDCIGFCRSPKVMAESLEKLRALPDDLVVYSGHDYGAVPFRTLGEEKVMNPEFSQEFITRLRN